MHFNQNETKHPIFSITEYYKHTVYLLKCGL